MAVSSVASIPGARLPLGGGICSVRARMVVCSRVRSYLVGPVPLGQYFLRRALRSGIGRLVKSVMREVVDHFEIGGRRLSGRYFLMTRASSMRR